MLAAVWITAIATAVLAVGAVITSVFAIKAFSKQAEEVRTLEQQARDQAEVLQLQTRDLQESLDDRKRQAEERRRAQAEEVFMWIERPDRIADSAEAPHQSVDGPHDQVEHMSGTTARGLFRALCSTGTEDTHFGVIQTYCHA